MGYTAPIAHHSMIFDDTRNRLYSDAIKMLVSQDSVVMDLGAETTWVYDISEVGDVAGTLGSLGDQHAFLYTLLDGLMDLGSLSRRSSSSAFGVNDLGQVVGIHSVFKGGSALSLGLPQTYEFLNLDDLIDPVANDPVTLARWYASNVGAAADRTTIGDPLPGEAFGQIAGASTLDSVTEAYVLTPVPPEE